MSIAKEAIVKVYPVVHTREWVAYTAVRESVRAIEIGADGIYLTDRFNGFKDKKPLFEAYQAIAAKNPEQYIGVNVFGSGAYMAMRALARATKGQDFTPDALLIDDMRQDGIEKSSALELRNSEDRLSRVRIIGSVAAKHTFYYTESPAKAAYEVEWLKDSLDVVASDAFNIDGTLAVDKLAAMKEAAGGKPLAAIGNFSIEDLSKLDGIVDEAIYMKSQASYYGSDAFDHHKIRELVELAHSLTE